jgi:hypothetical protein
MSDATVITDPRLPSEAPTESDDVEFVAPELVECDNCVTLHNHFSAAEEQYIATKAEQTATIAEAHEENRSLTTTLATQVRAFHNFKKEQKLFTTRVHELNKLRAAVDVLMNLGVPIKDMLAPEHVELLLDMEPSQNPSAFVNPLAKTPPGAWGGMRLLAHLDSSDPSPALYSTAGAEYFITREFSEYRLALAKYFIDHRVFRCSNCNCPMHTKFNWCLCMRCLSVPYCGRICLQQDFARHSVGCAQSHVWRASIPFRAQYVPEEPTSSSSSSTTTSSSSSSSSATGGGDRQSAKRRRGGNSNSRDNSTKPCRFYTEKGSCNPKPGNTCDFKHCNEARKAYLVAEAAKL